MKLIILIIFTLYTIQAQQQTNPNQSTYNYVPLSSDNAVLLFIDQQTGLANAIRDKSLVEWRNSLIALGEIGKYFDLPTVISSSLANGPNGPIYPDLLNLLPNATVINRQGEINAMDNSDFSGFINSTGRSKFIVSGIFTEASVAFVALSLIDMGYDTYVAFDSSGTYDKFVQEIALERLVHKGVIPMTWFAIAGELQKDWRNQNTSANFTQILIDHLPWYSNLYSSYMNQQQQSNTSGTYSNSGSSVSSSGSPPSVTYTQPSSGPNSQSTPSGSQQTQTQTQTGS